MPLFVALMAAALATADAPEAPQSAAPATPAPPAAAAPPAEKAKKNPMDEVVCKRLEITGSRLGPKQVCRTRRAWEEMTRDSQENIRDIQNRSQFSVGGG